MPSTLLLSHARVPCGTGDLTPWFAGWHVDTLVDRAGDTTIINPRGPAGLPPLRLTSGRWHPPFAYGTLVIPGLHGYSVNIADHQPVGIVIGSKSAWEEDAVCEHIVLDTVAGTLGCALDLVEPRSNGLIWPVTRSRSVVRWACALGRSALLASVDQVVGFGHWASGPPPYAAWTAGPDGAEIAILTPE